MNVFLNVEISIYSRAGFFIYAFKDFWRFSTKQIKWRYLHKINEKSRAGINGYFYIKNPLLWEWHFHKLLCEEMIFPLPSVHIFSLVKWKYKFFTQRLWTYLLSFISEDSSRTAQMDNLKETRNLIFLTKFYIFY